MFIKRIAALFSSILFLSSAITASTSNPPRPDEGMWLPLYIKQQSQANAQKLGLKLSADDIYNINKASLKDAILRMGSGFCTAEIVSAEGLVFTNHHCGYESVAGQSTTTNDYLKDGFWAYNQTQEIRIPDLTVSRLVYMENVTEKFQALNKMPESLRIGADKSLRDSIITAAKTDPNYSIEIADYFEGNEQYLLVYETFRDVRLVGVPPSSVGKFGGDVDNWMWPRHTGDFSIFRIYVGKDNKPADYSTENVPYKPLHYLPISLKKQKDDDFSMIMGYPGNTDRYLTSDQIEFNKDYVNPAVIDAFGIKLGILKDAMDNDRALALTVASDYASGMNTYKYYQGQQRLLIRKDLVGLKKKEEEKFQAWVTENKAREVKYGSVLKNIKNATAIKQKLEPANSYTIYGIFQTTPAYGFKLFQFYNGAKEIKDKNAIKASFAATGISAGEFVRKAEFASDKKSFKAILTRFLDKTDASNRPQYIQKIADTYKGKSNMEAANLFVENIYKNSFLLDSVKFAKWMKKTDVKKLEADPLFQFTLQAIEFYISSLRSEESTNSATILSENVKLYMEGLREWKNTKVYYPNANSTLRFTYGSVKPYFPFDGASYKSYTTHVGILEKSNKEEEEFNTPVKILDLLKEKKWGGYDDNDSLHICFLTNNDITGGNSGSPVMDGEGRLIGLAFDGNWEAMLGDLYVDPKVNRTICVDAHYVLWVIDVYAGAKNIIKELTIVR